MTSPDLQVVALVDGFNLYHGIQSLDESRRSVVEPPTGTIHPRFRRRFSRNARCMSRPDP